MRNRMAITFATPDGARTHAPPEAATRSDDGTPYVWIRTHGGEITRAFATGEIE
ncbi:hypothetical protein M1M40_gp10 [Halorubrum tailed virus 29]|uniref:Uncharacterized protein n=1 Tax=Halorubrum tailed virus 29 TaxID=2878010 RepID=A0AAE9BYM3_9CAUD|nr:hypothetical protein M1M40_gp10 [Halorubrum tailed virus 29]UBF23288.1 hypothetical protein HRTV-29_gp10 [Halorubrum tailed virus 29]